MPYQLRDLQWASRAVAYLMMAAAPYLFVTGVVLTRHETLLAVIAVLLTCLFLAVAGAACRWVPDRVPRYFWLAVPFLSIGLIGGLNFVTRDSSTGAQLFYLWPVLYATNFLSRRVTTVTLILVSAAEATTVFPLLSAGAALGDWSSLTLAMTLTAFIVSSLRSRNDRLLGVLGTQAFADSLTGLANRRSFDAELARAVAWSHRVGEPIALLTLDVDHFKTINDTWGHAVGDEALKQIAEALRTAVQGDHGVVARLGGDEFVVLLRTDPASALRAAERIRAAVDRIDGLPGGPPQVSIGVAVLPDHAGTVEEFVFASDAALYDAKSGGRGRTAMAPAPTPRHNVDRLITEDTAVRH
ncbi:diguanylate cyclase [Micromonosporaceae bacterium Da 78-11]